MEAKAHLRYARISPMKVKIVLDLIRGQKLDIARANLIHTPKAASELLIKLLDSATANAEYKDMDRGDLFVSECFVTQGPTLKRIRPRAQGTAHRINKRTSHITLILKTNDENEEN